MSALDQQLPTQPRVHRRHRALRIAGIVTAGVLALTAGSALANTAGTAREIVVLNAGTALYAANVAASIAQGIALAREAIASGAARAKLDEFVRCTQGFSA